jgi:fucose permease
LTLKFNDTQMIRMGQCILAAGVLALLLPGPQILALSGLVLVGLGCAPIYPSIIHSTPEHFGADRSQAVIGIQMASAYLGNLAMPPLFGLLANNITPALFPFYLLALLVLMVFMHEQLVRKTSRC